MALVGYFTITIKPISINVDSFSNTMKRKIARVSEFFLEADNNEKRIEFGTYADDILMVLQFGFIEKT